MHLDKVLKLVYCWHEHSVYVDLAEKHRNVRDSWWQVKMMGLLSLTRMACRNKPLDIFIQHGPPEMLPKIGEGRKDGPMTNSLMHSGDEGVTLFSWYDNFVMALDVKMHELSSHQEEL